MKDEHDTKTKELAIKPAPKTNAERQKEYRKRAKEEGLARIDMRIDYLTYRLLEDLANFHKLTKKATLEKIIKGAFAKALDESESFRIYMAEEEIKLHRWFNMHFDKHK